MKLSDLLKPYVTDMVFDCQILGLTVDHRLIKPGFAFVVLHAKAIEYIQAAIEKGAVVILYHADLELPECACPMLPVSQLRQRLSAIAGVFYQNPFYSMSCIGITGTNGKTTVAYLLMQALSFLHFKAAYIGTLGVGDLQSMQPTGMTTPGPIEIQELGDKLLKQDVECVAMEVSSHGLDQDRVSAIPFEQAIFTNLSHDHLDYHLTFEDYAAAKSKLFSFQTLTSIVVNGDDPYGTQMLKFSSTQAKTYRYGVHPDLDIILLSKEWTLEGMSLELQSPWGQVALKSALLGDFNVYNIMAVFTALMARGYELSEVVRAIEQLKAAPGRMEVVAKKPLVIVDYAHTPDALEKVLKTLKTFQKQTQAGRLWVIFGCGGDRDPFKRPMMGKIACDQADVVVLTSDNPRHENPLTILQQIIEGMPIDYANKHVIEDRRLAIISALQEAKNDDIILIAGKGHENYQQIGDKKSFFSDQHVVLDFFSHYKT